MVHKKQPTPEQEPIELTTELPIHDELPEQTEGMKVVSPIRGQVRLMPDFQWGALVTEMRHYVTTHHDFITSSLQKHREVVAKLVVVKKKTRTAQPKAVILRDDIPVDVPAPEAHVHLEELHRSGQLKRKRTT